MSDMITLYVTQPRPINLPARDGTSNWLMPGKNEIDVKILDNHVDPKTQEPKGAFGMLVKKGIITHTRPNNGADMDALAEAMKDRKKASDGDGGEDDGEKE